MSKSPYSGIGCIYAAPVDANGVKTAGYRKIGNAYPLSVQVQTEQKKQISRLCDTAGQTLGTKTQITDTVGSMSLHEWDAANLAWAVSGSSAEMTTAGATVTDEDVTALPAGEYVEFEFRDVSAVLIQDVTDAITYVEGTDYILNADLGMITIIEAGGIAAADVLHVDYTYASESGYQVSIGTNTMIRVAILANLTNEFSGDKFAVELYSVVLASSAELNFISAPDTEFESLEFTLSLETPTGQTCPGTIDGIPM